MILREKNTSGFYSMLQSGISKGPSLLTTVS